MNVSPVEKRYLSFSSEIHAEGSNTAVSYVAALNKIDTALHLHKVFLAPNKSVWDIRDIKRLTELYELIKGEQKKARWWNLQQRAFTKLLEKRVLFCRR